MLALTGGKWKARMVCVIAEVPRTFVQLKRLKYFNNVTERDHRA